MTHKKALFIAFEQRITKVWFFFAAFLLALNMGVAVWKLLPLSKRVDPIALHYSVIMGIDRLAAWYWAFLPVVLALCALFINAIIAGRFLHKERAEIAFAICLQTAVLELLFLAGTLLIVLLNVGISWTL